MNTHRPRLTDAATNQGAPMVTQHLTPTDSASVAAAAQHLYEAECALHTAHQSHLDAWIAAAGDGLHDAVVEYLAAEADALRTETADQ